MSSNSKAQAIAQKMWIMHTMERLISSIDPDTEDYYEEIHQEIQEDPLSVQVRTGWFTVGEPQPPVEEFCILLVTGGPAVRIRGSLGAYTEPERAYLEHQDWFEPWVELPLAAEEEEILLSYCREFYYGE